MNRQTFYNGLEVEAADLNLLEDNVEEAQRNISKKLIGHGVVNGLMVSPASPADLTVLVSAGVGVDQYGKIVEIALKQTVDLSGNLPTSNARYVSICVKSARSEYDSRTDELNQTVKYRSDETFALVVLSGDAAASPEKPVIPADHILLDGGDVLLSAGQTSILESHIDSSRTVLLPTLQAHADDQGNPHAVAMSQLSDRQLAGDLDANGKKITNLPAASASTEPVRKNEFDSHLANESNPHSVAMSQLSDRQLAGDMDANGKKITNLPAASVSTEPIRKNEFDTFLTGMIIAWTKATAPDGWLECNGAAVSRATYANLFSCIGVMYGSGNGTTTFNLPDLRGRFIRGWDHGAGIDPNASARTTRGDGLSGDNVGTKQADAFEDHYHSSPNGGSLFVDTPNNSVMNASSPNGGAKADKTGSAVGGGSITVRLSTETRPINIALMYCIHA